MFLLDIIKDIDRSSVYTVEGLLTIEEKEEQKILNMQEDINFSNVFIEEHILVNSSKSDVYSEKLEYLGKRESSCGFTSYDYVTQKDEASIYLSYQFFGDNDTKSGVIESDEYDTTSECYVNIKSDVTNQKDLSEGISALVNEELASGALTEIEDYINVNSSATISFGEVKNLEPYVKNNTAIVYPFVIDSTKRSTAYDHYIFVEYGIIFFDNNGKIASKSIPTLYEEYYPVSDGVQFISARGEVSESTDKIKPLVITK